jgi:hypothetical protein
MATQDAAALSDTLKAWEVDYQAARDQLVLQDLRELRALLGRLFEQVNRDATGPSSSPILAPPDDASN